MHIRSHFLQRFLRVVGVCTVAFGLGAISNGAVAAGISTSKHNLSTSGTGSNHVTAGTAEICVFCHTPHASNTANVNAPLWNKQFPATTYQTYSSNSSTLDGEVLAVGSVSQACLSCHDGTQAMDNIINNTGSGGLDNTGGGVNGLAYTWATSTRVNAAGLLAGVASLGSDLRNDHPIGIRYCGGGQNQATPTGACTDPDFIAPTNGTINGQQVWWVNTTGTGGGVAATREKQDMILYTRTFAAGVNPGAGPSVECASCHDPHLGNTTTTFLRMGDNATSKVCLACHNK